MVIATRGNTALHYLRRSGVKNKLTMKQILVAKVTRNTISIRWLEPGSSVQSPQMAKTTTYETW